ncbi:CCAAT/enhancer-binding protein zeta isoform X2 [Dermacentor albipictus]|uniref:CCAAT/enhancer-binding protein zeta isoform X2 n=1 Tax=Dermacentor albipictus TaxID=60249 RepID=UPI0038FC4351
MESFSARCLHTYQLPRRRSQQKSEETTRGYAPEDVLFVGQSQPAHNYDVWQRRGTMAAPIAMADDVQSSGTARRKHKKESLPRPKIFKKTNAKFHNNVSKPPFGSEASEAVKFNQMLVKPNKKWYEQLPVGDSTTVPDNPPELVSAKRKLAEALFEHDKELYKKHGESRARASDMRWVRTVLSKGVLADKVAAHTLLIQESPLHNLASVDALLAMVTPKGKKECLLAMDALRDLFLSDLLVPDKKLKAFCQRPLASLNGSGPVESRTLLLWHFEDLLKQRYATFLQSVETVSFDQVEKLKLRAVTCMFHMLTYHPEKELFLLERLINKLGDRMHSVASRVAHYLTQLTNHHPRMKGAVLTEVDRFVYRPNVAPKAQYYALCFLSQLLLSDNDVMLARSLVSFYFTFFKKCVQRSKVADARTMKVLLTGVNRAFPYARASDAEGLPDDQVNLMFRLVHLTDFNIAVQALTLLFQILDAKSSLSDRFYGALYRKALDPALEHSSHQTMFLNLLYKSLKRDTENNRVKAFLKRLLQACLYRSPHLACGILFLVSEVLKLRPTLLDARTFDDSHNEAPECAVQMDDNESDGEHYDDAPDDSDNEDATDAAKSARSDRSGSRTGTTSEKQSTGSWVHTKLTTVDESGSMTVERRRRTGYDPLARNPLYCGAEFCPAWELRHLSRHHHPSVALFAERILRGQPVAYPGDPLQDFTLSRFLDRFVYRNPKATGANEPIMEDQAASVFGKRRQYVPKGVRKMDVLSRQYQQQVEANIPPEETFLYRYFKQERERRKAEKVGDEDKKKKKKEADEEELASDAESVASDDVGRVLDMFEPGVDGELDFASAFSGSKKRKKGRAESDDSDDEESDEDDDLEGLEDDEEYQEALKGLPLGKGGSEIQEEDIEFSDDDDEFSTGGKRPLKELPNRGKVKSKGFDLSKLVASAEEFSHLLEENAGGVDTTTSQAVSNKDKASAKQLRWERDRDAWVRGEDWRSRKRKPGTGSVLRRGKMAGKRQKRR